MEMTMVALTEHQFCGFHASLEKFVLPVTWQMSSDGLHLLLENLYAEGVAVKTKKPHLDRI
jgi:hypothetical protein